MKKISAILCLVLLMTTFGLAQTAQPAPSQPDGQTVKKMENEAKTVPAAQVERSERPEKIEKTEKKEKREKRMPESMSDGDILKCINGKFASSEKLNAQGFTTAVEAGVATLTGKAANAGSKGAATRIAKSCGAKSVDNKISAPAIPRPAKKDEKPEK